MENKIQISLLKKLELLILTDVDTRLVTSELLSKYVYLNLRISNPLGCGVHGTDVLTMELLLIYESNKGGIAKKLLRHL